MLHQSLLDFPLLSPAVARFKRQRRRYTKGGFVPDPVLLAYGVVASIPPSLRGAGKDHHRRHWRMRWVYRDGLCSYCVKRLPLTDDHVVPRSAGGGNGLDNIVPACRKCNSAKGDKSLLMFLLGRAA